MDTSLLIRADANAEIGTGHVMRCLALAQTWGINVALISFSLPQALQMRLEAAGISCHLLDRHSNDLQHTLSILRQYNADWLILDGYHFDTTYQKAVRQAGHKLLVIDDYAHLPAYEADLLLNQNITANQYPYSLNPDAVSLLGVRYCLLRSDFKGQAKEAPEVKASNLLVTLGGSDPENITLSILKSLEALPLSGFSIRVVVGSANVHRASIESFAAQHSMKVLNDVSDMPRLMRWADIAIASGGVTCLELASIGVPTFVLSIARNQDAIVERLGQLGAMISLGAVHEIKFHQLAEKIQALADDYSIRLKMCNFLKAMVDYHGSERVVQVMRTEDTTTIRAVTLEDAFLLWEWANDAVTRQNSLSSAPILWETHLQWLSRKLTSPETRMWILVYRTIPVALIRYDHQQNDSAVISYQVAPSMRGRGFGTQILNKTADLACDELGVTTLRGETLTSNIASIRAFQKSNFRQSAVTSIAGQPALVFTQTRL